MDKDVHTEHCCKMHGCKYGDENCTVTTRQKKQSFPCEWCDEEREQELSKWIDVEETPPDNIGQKCLIYPIDGEVEAAEYIGEGWWKMHDYKVYISDITHWQPCPIKPN